MTTRADLGDRVKGFLKNHFIEATAINLAANPLYGSFESFLLQLPANQVAHARTEGTLLTYLGVGGLWAVGRDYIQKSLTRAGPLAQGIAVGAYSFAFNAGLGEIFYRNTAHPHRSSLILGAVSFPFGIMIGYAKDYFPDLVGHRKFDKLPPLLEQDEKTKRRLATAFGLSSVAYTVGLYVLRQ
jgi:hypothetical protein